MTLSDVQTGDPHVAAHNAERHAINAHVADTSNPHAVTKAQVGLPLAENTSDANKPVSAAQQAAIDSAINALKAGAPAAFDTLNELATQFTNDENAAAALTTLVSAIRNLSDTPFKTALDAAYAANADTLALTRIERQSMQTLRSLSNRARARADDALAKAYTEAWADLTGWPNAVNMAVSGGRVSGATAATWSANHAINLAAGARGIFRCLIHTGGAIGNTLYVGVNNDAAGAAVAAGVPKGIALGVNATGNMSFFRGASVTQAWDGGSNTSALAAGDYLLTILIDETDITMTIHSIGGVFNTASKVARAALPGGPAVNNLLVSGDSTAAGHYISSAIWIPELTQPYALNQRVVNGVTLFGTTGTYPLIERKDVTTGIRHIVALPSSYDPRVPAPVAVFLHGSTAHAAAPWSTAGKEMALMASLEAAGYIVCSSDNGLSIFGTPANDTSAGSDNKYGNQAGIDDYVALVTYVRQHFNTGAVFLVGTSMGGTFTERILSQRVLGGVAAAALICPGLDLVAAEQNATYQTGVQAAWGASSTAQFLTAVAGKNPIDLLGQQLRGVPQRFYVASDDTTAPPATHTEPLRQRLLAYAPEASVLTTTGGHVAASTYQPADMLAFFEKYRY